MADQWHAREEEEERAREEEWARAAHDILTTWLLAYLALHLPTMRLAELKENFELIRMHVVNLRDCTMQNSIGSREGPESFIWTHRQRVLRIALPFYEQLQRDIAMKEAEAEDERRSRGIIPPATPPLVIHLSEFQQEMARLDQQSAIRRAFQRTEANREVIVNPDRIRRRVPAQPPFAPLPPYTGPECDRVQPIDTTVRRLQRV